ncbi:MAG TPA: hypothetical protein VIW23_08785 [Candidatus Acidoferrum sp.]
MRSMTSDEARKWCSQDAVRLSLTRDEVLRYKSAGKHKLFVTAPQEHRRIIVLARTILLFRGEADFSGGLLWLRRWDIGSPQLVRVGWRILEDIRRAHGESRSLEVAPAQLFRDDELVELHAFLVQAIAFGWVADFIPSTGGFFAHFKDNRQVCLFADSSETLKEMRTSFRDWKPTDQDPMVAKMELIRKARPEK